jgi:hypothetical protein
MNDHHLDRAVANLFDATADPELIFPLVLANLMSPRLWEISNRLPRSSEPDEEFGDGGIRCIQEFVDHHFEHVDSLRVAEMNGLLDLDAEAERLGATVVEYALARLLSTYNWRVERGTLPKDAVALDLIKRRKFPSYVYATIDEAWANRRLLGRRKHKPLGLTCCLDEAAIFVALVLILSKGSVDDFAFIAAPTHYSVFLWTAEGAWWFYTKHHTCPTARACPQLSRMIAATN